MLREVLAGPPAPVNGAAQPWLGPLPTGLVSACERAMARDPADRHRSAQELADEIEAWLDGAHRREQALQVTRRALEGVSVAEQLHRQAERLRAESDRMLAGIEAWQPEQDKAPAWTKADEADHTALIASLTELEVEQGLHGALQIAAYLPDAHQALAEIYRERHQRAERARDHVGASRAALRLSPHLAALAPDHPTRVTCSRYLRGHGAITLVTDPPGAEVLLYRYEERNRRLVEVFDRSLGTTPLFEVGVEMGSYLCLLRKHGYDDVRYPIHVTRLRHWDGVRPGDVDPHPVWLPKSGVVGPDQVYVPAGPFASGDPKAYAGHLPRDLWCDGFVIHRHPITNAQYVAFLNDHLARGHEEEALLLAPRERAGATGTGGALIYGRRQDGTFVLGPDGDGDLWLPDHPVSMIEWHGARAYLAWLVAREGRPWRLPGELEWEKAARGVDGRAYPWGAFGDPSWSRVRDGLRGRKHGDWGWSEVGSYPVDVSPFGLRGAAGNVLDWCLDKEGRVEDGIVSVPMVGDATADSRIARGASWSSTGVLTRLGRISSLPSLRNPNLGFRGLFRVL